MSDDVGSNQAQRLMVVVREAVELASLDIDAATADRSHHDKHAVAQARCRALVELASTLGHALRADAPTLGRREQ